MATVWPDSRRAASPRMAGWVNVGLMTAAVAVLAVTMAPERHSAGPAVPAPALVRPAVARPAGPPRVPPRTPPSGTPRATPERVRLARLVSDTPTRPLARTAPPPTAGPTVAMPSAPPLAARQLPHATPARSVAND